MIYTILFKNSMNLQDLAAAAAVMPVVNNEAVVAAVDVTKGTNRINLNIHSKQFESTHY